MDIFKIIAFAIVALVMIIILDKTNKEYSLALTIISAVIILVMIMTKLDEIISLLENLVTKAGINKNYLIVLLKVTGIAYIVEIAKNICVDAGKSSLATKIEIAGKVSVVSLTIPIITSTVTVIVDIL